jgi:ATP-dependent RNA helicase RhlE
MLADASLRQVIVFARTKHGADLVARNLERDGFQAAVIHGNKSQNARQRALSGFRDGSVRVLVATDIAARGIDVPGISHVVNYDLPDEAESYVHRIGRTGRNGADGIAVTLCAPEENDKLREVERIIRMRLPVEASHLSEPDPAPRESGAAGSRPRDEAAPGGSRKGHRPQGPRSGEKHREGQAGGNRHALPASLMGVPAGRKPFRRRRPDRRRPASKAA